MLQQATGFPDDPVISLSVVSGAATMTLRVRVPAWADGPPVVVLNGTLIPDAVGRAAGSRSGGAGRPGTCWQVTLPMRLAFEPTPDHPTVQAVTYGPVVLSGVYPANPGALTPALEAGSVQQTAAQPMTFGGRLRRQAGHADPGEPRRPRVLHGVLADGIASRSHHRGPLPVPDTGNGPH